MIQYIHHADIDREKWDQTVQLAVGGMPYALSWYLDLISPNWDALIEGDYECIMPVTVKSKYTLRYVIQPPFAQQLGVFSPGLLEEKQIKRFCDQLISRYGYVNIHLNFSNRCTYFDSLLPNYVLDLNKDYNQLRRFFSENHRRNLQKIKQSKQLNAVTDILQSQIETFIHRNESFRHLIPSLILITKVGCDKNMGSWQVAVNEKEEIVSAIYWLKFNNRHIYLYSLSSDEGKSKRASFFLVNEYIRRYAEQSVLIDFEGSRISGIARFFEGFGAKVEYYPVYRYMNSWRLFFRSFMPA